MEIKEIITQLKRPFAVEAHKERKQQVVVGGFSYLGN
jgi:hypothetical protein